MCLAILALGCSERTPQRAATPEEAKSTIALQTRSPNEPTNDPIRYTKYKFTLVPPSGWTAAPDSAVSRIRAGFDSTLMNGHQLVAVMVPSGQPWDGIVSIRVTANDAIDTDPVTVLAALRRAVPYLQESLDSIAATSDRWNSISMSRPLWDSRRKTLWALSEASEKQGTILSVTAARMYRVGQISLHYNCLERRQLTAGYQMLVRLIDQLDIPVSSDWN